MTQLQTSTAKKSKHSMQSIMTKEDLLYIPTQYPASGRLLEAAGYWETPTGGHWNYNLPLCHQQTIQVLTVTEDPFFFQDNLKKNQT